MLRSLRLLLLGLSVALLAPLPVFAAASSLAGSWTIDPARSTELSPWRTYALTIKVDRTQVTIDRQLGWGRRVHAESMQVPLDGTSTSIAVPYWADNRHLGAYIGGDRQKQVRARLLDGGRILRLESDLTVETQQGERAINILSDYHLSVDGQTLTLIEIRSTRSRPIVYVFRRATS
jgi:hypothetical protein